MIDFSTDTVFKLKQVDLFDGEKMVSGLLVEGEPVEGAAFGYGVAAAEDGPDAGE